MFPLWRCTCSWNMAWRCSLFPACTRLIPGDNHPERFVWFQCGSCRFIFFSPTASSFLHRRCLRFQHYVANSDRNEPQSLSLTLEFNIDPLLPPGGHPVTLSLMSSIAQTLQLYIKNPTSCSWASDLLRYRRQSANIQIHLKSQFFCLKNKGQHLFQD